MIEKDKLERRFKILYIDQQIILNMVAGLYKHEYVKLPDFSSMLPEDATVLDVRFDFERLSFGFLVYSKTFQIVPQFAIIPAMDSSADFQYKTIKLPKDEK
ncbi:MAG: hypothetical protein ABSG99_02770 [Sedimentisphaerales bacterium]